MHILQKLTFGLGLKFEKRFRELTDAVRYILSIRPITNVTTTTAQEIKQSYQKV